MKHAEAIDRTPSAIKTKAPARKQRQYQALVFFFPAVKVSNAVLFCILVCVLKIMEAAGPLTQLFFLDISK
jgi:hypothetical protein